MPVIRGQRILPGKLFGKLSGILVGLFLIGGCIDPYTPKINETADVMVINGRITDLEGYQYVEVSRTSPLFSDRGSNPLSDCVVMVEDERGKTYAFDEVAEGRYACWMAQADLFHGNSYELTVVSPEGKIYVSDFEELLPSPPIEEIPWELKVTSTSNPDVSYMGVQFFITTNASGNYAKNYLWELEETWRYFSHYWIWDIYDSIREYEGDPSVGIIRGTSEEPSDSLLTCYKTLPIPEIYTYSTKNISGDFMRNIPINYVSDQTDRLYSRYSLLARQYSLTDMAYEFWKTLEGQAKQSGELYGTQPAMIRGNMVSEEDPRETVLGLFFATSVTEKRIFVWPNIQTFRTYCAPHGYDEAGLLEYLSNVPAENYPVYLYRVNDSSFDYAEQSCFDCRLKGGSLTPPSFWED